MSRTGYVFVGALLVGTVFLAGCAFADGRCESLSETKKTVAGYGGKWTELNRDQWQFLRGISVVEPNTPNGLPIGDKAVAVTATGRQMALVFFIDGALACDVMEVPTKLIDILNEVRTGVIKHEGAL